MRRAPIVITATVVGTAGVLLFKPLATPSLAGTGDGTTGTSTSATAGSTTDGTTSSSAEPTTEPSASASSGGSSAAGAKDGTYTGEGKTTRFGTTQVKVTISGGKITDVQTVQLNQNDPRSYSISVDAAPQLRTEVLSKQTAAVDTISGATYTSVAYEASLQSALDKAGFAAADGSKASTDVSSLQEGGFGH